jgi:hypothetical protein
MEEEEEEEEEGEEEVETRTKQRREDKLKKTTRLKQTRETLREIGPFRIPLKKMTARNVSAIVREILKYVLYSRAQIPLTYEDLINVRNDIVLSKSSMTMSAKEAHGKRKRNSSITRSDKKLIARINAIESVLMDSINEEEFANRRATQVALCFGSNASKPVETYVLDFEDVLYESGYSNEDDEEDEKKRKEAKSAANRLVRAMMPTISGLTTTPTPTSQKIWVFLKHEEDIDGTTNRFVIKRNIGNVLELAETSGLKEIQSRKAKPKGKVFARIVLKSSTKSLLGLEKLPNEQRLASSSSWFQSVCVPKGFRFKD